MHSRRRTAAVRAPRWTSTWPRARWSLGRALVIGPPAPKSKLCSTRRRRTQFKDGQQSRFARSCSDRPLRLEQIPCRSRTNKAARRALELQPPPPDAELACDRRTLGANERLLMIGCCREGYRRRVSRADRQLRFAQRGYASVCALACSHSTPFAHIVVSTLPHASSARASAARTVRAAADGDRKTPRKKPNDPRTVLSTSAS